VNDIAVSENQTKDTRLGWEKVLLRDGAVLLSGHHVLARYCNTDGHGTPYITGPSDFPDGKIRQTKFTTRPATICRAGDVLVVVKGSGSGTIVASDAEYCISRQLMAVRASKWNGRFLFYSLAQNASGFHAASTGLIPGLSRSDILDQQLPVPRSTEEQRAIAAALSEADDVIATLQRLIVKKQAVKQGMMQQLLTGSIRLPGFRERWETAELGDHFEITSSKRVFQKDWRTSGVPFYRARELAVLGATGRVNNEIFIDRTLYEEFKRSYGAPADGDFLVTGVGTLGKTYVVRPGDEFYFKDGNIIWFKASHSVDSQFLSFLYRTPAITRQIEDASSGTTVGTYTITNAKKTKISLPSLEEQRAIAAVLRDVDDDLRVLRERLAKANAIKQGMMQELLTGRTRLPVAEAVA
jgi:type I restriction enzyme, S subunit